MSDLLNRIHAAQVHAGEQAVIDDLRRMGLMPAAEPDPRDARIAEMEAALAEAIDDIESWGGYASEYFQDKHDLPGCLVKHRAVLNRSL